MIKIVHTADTHLGFRQYQSDIRKNDFYSSFEFVINEAINIKADVIVHAGDLFDSRTPSLEDLIKTIKILTNIKKNNILFLAIVGNHEMKLNNQWLDLFTQMNLSIRLNNYPFIFSKDNVNISFYGLDNISTYKYNNLEFEIFKPEDHIKNNYSILVMHQLLSPLVQNGSFSCFDFLSKFEINFDILLLGDSHKNECKTIKYFPKHSISSHKCQITYSGSTERCNSSEIEPRYYNIITLTEKTSFLSKKQIITREFIIITVLCHQNDSFNILNDRIMQEIDNNKQNIMNSVVFIELTGNNKTLINFNDIENYILNLKACTVNIKDNRNIEEITIKNEILFLNPEEVISKSIENIKLTDYGFLIDQQVRNEDTPTSRLNDTLEKQLLQMLEHNTTKNSDVLKSNNDIKSKEYKIRQYTLENKME